MLLVIRGEDLIFVVMELRIVVEFGLVVLKEIIVILIRLFNDELFE